MNKEQFHKVKQKASAHNAQLIAVTKTRSITELETLYREGHRHFGENRVAELVAKQADLPKDIQWHMIGHLQRKKVKKIASFIACIHSVDSLKLAEEINKRAAQHNRIIPCLLQLHIAQEESKYGFMYKALDASLANGDWKHLQHLKIAGIMGMATQTQDQTQIRSEFRQLKHYFTTWKQQYFAQTDGFKEVSMGMSGDYHIALEEGSTMVRVGSLLFNE